MRPKAITFDFFQTLARPRGRRGRGELYHDFLAQHGLQAAPWDHQVLYDVFEYYGAAYDPTSSPAAKEEFWRQFACRLMSRTEVIGDHAKLGRVHATAIRDIFGVSHFELYPDVADVLHGLNRLGIPLAVLSNWQAGLAKFCEELGIRRHFVHVIASAEVGLAKPDAEIFREVCRRLSVPAADVLHVGDSLVDDLQGATAAGLTCILIDREGQTEGMDGRVIRDLRQLIRLVDGE